MNEDPSRGAVPQKLPTISVIIPTLNSMPELAFCVSAVLRELRRFGSGEVIVADNGSTDGTLEYLAGCSKDASIKILHRPHASVGELRNEGAREAAGRILSFLDSDCVVQPHFFERLAEVLDSGQADATGSRVSLPGETTWIERAWHELHAEESDGYVRYLNSGNFAVLTAAFGAVGGFREDLASGEDSELGHRLNDQGFRIYACHAVAAVHLGNSKTMRDFLRRQTWHGVGMLATAGRRRIDKPVAMLGVHLILVAVGLALVALRPWGIGVAIAALGALSFVVPALTVAYRYRNGGGGGRLAQETFLYFLYYLARAKALGIIVWRRIWDSDRSGPRGLAARVTKSFRPRR